MRKIIGLALLMCFLASPALADEYFAGEETMSSQLYFSGEDGNMCMFRDTYRDYTIKFNYKRPLTYQGRYGKYVLSCYQNDDKGSLVGKVVHYQGD